MKLYDSSRQSFYDSAVLSPKRAWSADIGTASAETYPGCLKSFTLKECMSDGKNITMGNAICKRLTVNLINVPAVQKTHFYEGAEIDVFLNLYDYLGSANSCKIVTSHFYLDKPKFAKATNGNYSIAITAYDKMYQMSKVFSYSGASYLISDILQYIGNKYNLEIASDAVENDYTLDALDEEITDREMVGYIAGLYGKSAYINDDNELAFKWYTEYSTPVVSKYIYQGSDITEESESRTIKMLESGTQSNILVYPSSALGYSINFENPFMTAEYLQSIYESKIANNAATFTVGRLKFRGDPLMNAGSIVTVTDKEGISRAFYVMQRTLNYDGGLYDTIECNGESETTITYRKFSPKEKKIDRILSKMEEAIKNATDIITQTNGSIFELIPVNPDDPTQGNSGWKLYSKITNNVIVANSGGIGFSSDGGQTMGAAAIYIDENGQGHINANEAIIDNLTANMIKTGMLKATNGMAFFDLDSGYFQVGSSNYYTKIVSGSLEQYASGGNLIGGLVPVGNTSDDGKLNLSLYYNPQKAGGSVGIYEQNEDGSFSAIAKFQKSLLLISVPTEIGDNLTVTGNVTLSGKINSPLKIGDNVTITETITTESSSAFSGHAHTRKYTKNSVESSGTVKAGVGVWGDVTVEVDSSALIYDGLTSKNYSGNTYYTTSLAEDKDYPLTNWISVDGAASLELSFNYNSYGFCFFYLVYKTEDQVGTACYNQGTSFLKSEKGDVDSSDGYYSGNITIPTDAAMIAVWVTPENANSTYWAGWRNVEAKRFYGTKLSASLELSSGSAVNARLDVMESEGEAIGAIRLTSSAGTSRFLEFGEDNIWYKGIGILSEISSIKERLSLLEG